MFWCVCLISFRHGVELGDESHDCPSVLSVLTTSLYININFISLYNNQVFHVHFYCWCVFRYFSVNVVCIFPLLPVELMTFCSANVRSEIRKSRRNHLEITKKSVNR